MIVKDDIEIVQDGLEARVNYKKEPFCTFVTSESSILPYGQTRKVPLAEIRSILAKLEKLRKY